MFTANFLKASAAAEMRAKEREMLCEKDPRSQKRFNVLCHIFCPPSPSLDVDLCVKAYCVGITPATEATSFQKGRCSAKLDKPQKAFKKSQKYLEGKLSSQKWAFFFVVAYSLRHLLRRLCRQGRLRLRRRRRRQHFRGRLPHHRRHRGREGAFLPQGRCRGPRRRTRRRTRRRGRRHDGGGDPGWRFQRPCQRSRCRGRHQREPVRQLRGPVRAPAPLSSWEDPPPGEAVPEPGGGDPRGRPETGSR